MVAHAKDSYLGCAPCSLSTVAAERSTTPSGWQRPLDDKTNRANHKGLLHAASASSLFSSRQWKRTTWLNIPLSRAQHRSTSTLEMIPHARLQVNLEVSPSWPYPISSKLAYGITQDEGHQTCSQAICAITYHTCVRCRAALPPVRDGHLSECKHGPLLILKIASTDAFTASEHFRPSGCATCIRYLYTNSARSQQSQCQRLPKIFHGCTAVRRSTVMGKRTPVRIQARLSKRLFAMTIIYGKNAFSSSFQWKDMLTLLYQVR